MKKLITILFLTTFALGTTAYSEISVGVSGNLGILDAKGTETFNSKTNSRNEEMVMGYASVFAELHLGDHFRIGASYVPYELESETTENVRSEGETGSGDDWIANTTFTPKAAFTQKIQIDIQEITQAYLAIYPGNGLFIKTGVMEGDIITNESLGSGSTYGNATLEGTFIGAGIERDLPNGMFIRAEAQFTKFDDIKLQSVGSDNAKTIDVNGMSGTNGVISIGKTF
jgi:hypothetical protein